MSFVPTLNIVVAGADVARLHAALSMAAAWAALARPVRIFVQAEAVSLLRSNGDDRHERRSEAGIPALGELLETSISLGAFVIACQSGLALAGMTADQLPPGVDVGGLVDFLAKSGPQDQLMMA